MFCIQGSPTRKVALAGLMALGCISVAHAQTATPSSGLGQAWPNAADVSTSPHWHVYVFVLNGIKYVQVNDLNGNVHAAIGTAGGTTIVLPVGTDAQNVVATQAPAASTGETVYSDNSTTVTATPQSNGTMLFTATPATAADCTGYNCGGGRGG
jgi:hypothetical protein